MGSGTARQVSCRSGLARLPRLRSRSERMASAEAGKSPAARTDARYAVRSSSSRRSYMRSGEGPRADRPSRSRLLMAASQTLEVWKGWRGI